MKELELYIHIPFCVQKCRYCDFLSAPQDEQTRERYVEALLREIDAHKTKKQSHLVSTVFFGGGTPSVLSAGQMERIFQGLHSSFSIKEDAEITIEANPGTVTEEKLLMYRKCGVNRISFGLQSADNRELRILGRIHTYEAFLESFHMARACGFDNINVDLISAVPTQTVESYEKTLSCVLALEPEHISAYSLIVEEGTPFYELYGEGGTRSEELPDEEEERKMYHRTEELLSASGYHRYEISNYAKPGRECRHNLGYWERKDYLGLGLGSASLIENVRFHNTCDMEHYMECSLEPGKIGEEYIALTSREAMEEFVFLGLRKMEGISDEEFFECFGVHLHDVYGDVIAKMEEETLLQWRGNRMSLTRQGIDISNYVFAEFLQ